MSAISNFRWAVTYYASALSSRPPSESFSRDRALPPPLDRSCLPLLQLKSLIRVLSPVDGATWACRRRPLLGSVAPAPRSSLSSLVAPAETTTTEGASRCGPPAD